MSGNQSSRTMGVDGRLLLKAADTARALSISPRTLWALTHRGEIPFIRIGRSVRYDPRDLTAWIDRSKSIASPENSCEGSPQLP